MRRYFESLQAGKRARLRRRGLLGGACLCALLGALVVLLGSVTGCESKPEQREDLLIVGFSQLGSESDWRIANTKSMTDTFTEQNGFALEVDNAKQKQENQLAAVRDFILEGVDYIVIAPTVETGWDNVLREAKEAGIPVIIMDRSVAVEDESLYLTNIGMDSLKEGRMAVQWLSDTLEEQGRAGEPMRILHVQGTLGATAQLQRSRALEEAVAERESWSIVGQVNGDFTEARGYEVVRDYLSAGESFNVLYSENDNMTFGAMQAMDEAGITYGEGGDVTILSFDATRRALQHCLEGDIALCVECNPLHGPLVADLIRRNEAGATIPKRVSMEEGMFTKENLTQELIDQRSY